MTEAYTNGSESLVDPGLQTKLDEIKKLAKKLASDNGQTVKRVEKYRFNGGVMYTEAVDRELHPELQGPDRSLFIFGRTPGGSFVYSGNGIAPITSGVSLEDCSLAFDSVIAELQSTA